MARRFVGAVLCWVILGVAGVLPIGEVRAAEGIPGDQAKRIYEAAPGEARVRPGKQRRVLVWITPAHLMEKDPHKGYCIPYGTAAFEAIGKKTGAYEAVVSDDLAMYLPENIGKFDAIVMNNSSGAWITPTDADMGRAEFKKYGASKAEVEGALRKSLVDWVNGGGGIVAIHFAIAANPQWKQFQEMLGGRFTMHPWNEEVGVKVEEPGHPLVAAYGGKDFRIADEIYEYGDPFDRAKVRVLMSLDTERTNMGVKWINRKDNDFALAWVKAVGKGRIFYTSFGHRTELFWNRPLLQFYLDGIQFATGDLKAPVEPRADRPVHRGPGPSTAEERAAKMKARQVDTPTEEQIRKIEAAAPKLAPAKPAKKRRVLAWGHVWAHQPNPYAEKALEAMAKKTGAFEVVISDDPRLLLGDQLPRFDALVMNNIHEAEPFLPEDFAKLDAQQQTAAKQFDKAVKESILEFVRGGKGIVGIHAATAAFNNWAEYGKMMGGYYSAHIAQDVTIKVEEAQHPLCAVFGGKPWRINDEIYIFREPYSRENLRVLLSLDLSQMADPGKRTDGDYAVSWVSEYGKGRVFYTTAGHAAEMYWNPQFLEHVLAGIQFAIGDLAADATPRQAAREDAMDVRKEAEVWRAEHRLIDMHEHIDMTPEHIDRAVKIADAVGIGVVANLGTGNVTRGANGGMSDFERFKRLTDERYPGRFVHYMTLDYRGWDRPDFAENAVKQIEEGYRLGAAGLKEFKRLGLYLKDGRGKLIRIDDPKLDGVWERCGELGMPVSIHVADPKAFWLPYDEKNERWKELKDHRDWWFGDSARYPGWKELLEALNRVIAKHPKTTFVCVHFGNNAEELDWVEQALDRYPNMMVDLAARIPELGRHEPEKVRRLFVKHQDRILFGTDFQVYDRLILGSSGNEPPPTDADAQVFFAKEWRWLETRDTDWAHMTPIQGDWTISAIGLPASVLRKIYFDNARRLLARSLPRPVMRAARIEKDFEPDGDLSKAVWKKAAAVRVELSLKEAVARPELSTTVRCLWSANHLYFAFDCPYTKLTVFDPPQSTKRLGLWDRDVVEVFVGTDGGNIGHYGEFEVAPTNERLDVVLKLPEKDFGWNSGFVSGVKIDEKSKRWTAEVRIPLAAISEARPKTGAKWRLNLYRSDRAGNVFLAWNPTLTPSAHTPERFGILEFAE